MDRREYASYDGLGLADLVRRKQVSSAEVLAAAMAQIAAVNPGLNAIIELFAKPVEGSMAEGAPFLGVPFLLKDIGAGLAGVPTGCASRYGMLAPAPAMDDELTRRFRAAGLRILSKTNLPELGFNVTTEPALFGPTRNPWNPAYSAGGSSGGSAAAVAAGMTALAHATDGAGSIRIPAASCGLIGLKPSRGALPQGPAHADIYSGMVSEGVVSRTVRDSAAALDAIHGADAGAPYAAPARAGRFLAALDRPSARLRIGINRQCPDDVQPSAEALGALDRVARSLESLGHHVLPVDLTVSIEDLLVPRAVYLAQVCAQAATDMAESSALIGRAPLEHEIEPVNREAAARGRAMTASAFLACVRAGQRFTRRFAEIWRKIDVLLTPALAYAPPKLGSFPTDHGDVVEHVARMLRFSPFTAMFNVTGEPALVAPAMRSREGLPLAVQLAAPLGRDGRLLKLAAELDAGCDRLARIRPRPPPDSGRHACWRRRRHGHARGCARLSH